MMVNTTGYNTVKFWTNVGYYWRNQFSSDYIDSPYEYTSPSYAELVSGYEGANDGLYGFDEGECECGK
jgi:hypothetical protein